MLSWPPSVATSPSSRELLDTKNWYTQKHVQLTLILFTLCMHWIFLAIKKFLLSYILSFMFLVLVSRCFSMRIVAPSLSTLRTGPPTSSFSITLKGNGPCSLALQFLTMTTNGTWKMLVEARRRVKLKEKLLNTPDSIEERTNIQSSN